MEEKFLSDLILVLGAVFLLVGSIVRLRIEKKWGEEAKEFEKLLKENHKNNIPVVHHHSRFGITNTKKNKRSSPEGIDILGPVKDLISKSRYM